MLNQFLASSFFDGEIAKHVIGNANTSSNEYHKNGMTRNKSKVCRVRRQRCSPPANHSVNWRESSL